MLVCTQCARRRVRRFSNSGCSDEANMFHVKSRIIARSGGVAVLALTLWVENGSARQQMDLLGNITAKCQPPPYIAPPDPDDVGITWAKNKRYQLVIGADEYALSPAFNREFVGRTAKTVSARLLELGFAPLPMFATAKEPFLSGANATKDMIWQAVREMRQKTQGDDVGIIYYVGHGSITPNNVDLTLATQDRPIASDEGIRVSDIVGELSIGEYRNNTQEIPKIILILDTCYSGNFLGSDGRTTLVETEGVQKLAKIASSYPTPDKMVVLTATGQGTVNRAFELKGTGVSAFGFFFVRALSEDWACVDTTADGILTIREIYAFLNGRLQAARKLNLIEGTMRPLKRNNDENSFVIYDSTKYSVPGDRGALVALSASAPPGQVTTLTLPNGTTQMCQPNCSAILSRSLDGNFVLKTRQLLDMNSPVDAKGLPIGGKDFPKGVFFPPPPPPENLVETLSLRDVVKRGGHSWQGITVTVK
jgi:hypothetical protein